LNLAGFKFEAKGLMPPMLLKVEFLDNGEESLYEYLLRFLIGELDLLDMLVLKLMDCLELFIMESILEDSYDTIDGSPFMKLLFPIGCLISESLPSMN
jgi:hypothetical protein